MKQVRKFVGRSVFLAALATLPPATYAEQGTDAPAPPQKSWGKQVAGRGKMMDPERRLQRMTTRLGLSEEQQRQIKPILVEEASQLRAVRDDPQLTRDERRAKMRQINGATFDKIRPLLTPEQQQKHDALREEMMERTGRQGPPPQ